MEPIRVEREIAPGKGGARGEFIQGDTPALLPGLIERYAGRVKLVYLDPPFQTGGKFVVRVKAGEEDWLKSRPSLTFPAYDDSMPREEYYAMMRTVLSGCRELLADDGMLFLHIDYRTTARMRLMLDEIFGEERFLNEIIWAYQSGGRSKRYFSRKHDTILFYAKTERYDFDQTDVMTVPDKPRDNHMRRHVDPDGRVYRSIKSGGKVYTYYDDEPVAPSDVWSDLSHIQQKDPQRTGYDTQKPLPLLDRIVKCASRRGELVADLFCGSGTTLEAAQMNGRAFLGVDRSPFTANILRRRLSAGGYALSVGEAAFPLEAEARVHTGVGFYRVTLAEPAFPQGALPEGLTGWDGVDGWSAGYVTDGDYRIMAQAVRTNRQPALPQTLDVPVYMGELCVAIYDVAGNSHYYRVPASSFNLA